MMDPPPKNPIQNGSRVCRLAYKRSFIFTWGVNAWHILVSWARLLDESSIREYPAKKFFNKRYTGD